METRARKRARIFLVESRAGGVSSNYYDFKLSARDLASFLTTPTTRALPIKKALLLSVASIVWLSGNWFNLSSSIGVSLLSFPDVVSTTCLNLEAPFPPSPGEAVYLSSDLVNVYLYGYIN